MLFIGTSIVLCNLISIVSLNYMGKVNESLFLRVLLIKIKHNCVLIVSVGAIITVMVLSLNNFYYHFTCMGL